MITSKLNKQSKLLLHKRKRKILKNKRRTSKFLRKPLPPIRFQNPLLSHSLRKMGKRMLRKNLKLLMSPKVMRIYRSCQLVFRMTQKSNQSLKQSKQFTRPSKEMTVLQVRNALGSRELNFLREKTIL